MHPYISEVCLETVKLRQAEVMLQNYSKELMIGLAVTFMALPIIFVGLRIWAKLLSAKRIGWDDYLAGFAAVSGVPRVLSSREHFTDQ